MSENISETEAQDTLRMFAESRQNIHSFLTKVAQEDDTTKVGFLTQEELGMPVLPVRTYKELAVFSSKIADEKEWADYFNTMSEVQTSTSLSKEGFLVKAAITTKAELAKVTKSGKKPKSSWFGSKGQSEEAPEPMLQQ